MTLQRQIKKVILILLVILLSGCNNQGNSGEDVKVIQYQSYISAIEANDEFYNTSPYFDIEVVLNKIGEESYRYDVIVDNPRIAMYDIQMLAIQRDVTGTLITDGMCPSAGILEDDEYNLIPNQVDVEKGYPAGVIISGTVEQPNVSLEVLVVWKGYAHLAENRAFFDLSGTYVEEVENTEGTSEEVVEGTGE